MTRPGIEPSSPGPLANTRLTRPMSRFFYKKKKKKEKKKLCGNKGTQTIHLKGHIQNIRLQIIHIKNRIWH